MSGGHARLAPSSAHTWVHCPGSVTMCEQFPDTSGSAALEGEAVHHAAAEALLGRTMPCVGATAPNGVVYTEEMIKAALVYVEAPRPQGVLHIEEHFSVPTVHPDCHGTPDAVYGSAAPTTLYVDDLKYGWGIVEAEENWQLLCYAAGAARRFQLILDGTLSVRLRIIQPRPYHPLGAVRSWTIDGIRLRHYETLLQQAALKALGPNPQCVTGGHCRYCSARHACPALLRSGYAAMEFSETAQPHVASPEAMSLMWEQLARAEQSIKFLKTGLEGQIMGMIMGGQNVPGLTTEKGKGRRAWDKPVAEVLALGELMGLDLRAPVDAVTPTQARDKGLPGELINAYSSIGETGLKLVPVSKSLAARVFGPAAAGAPTVR